MKARRPLRYLPLLLVTASFSSVSSAATHQYWNVGGIGGDGNWGPPPGDKNWNTTAGAPAGNTFWQDSPDDLAVFQDFIGGTVTVFDAVQTPGIVQTGADYLINAGTITLIPDSALADPFIDVQSGTLTIDSVLEGGDGLVKNGSGILVLTGSNTYDGTTTITAGALLNTGSLGNITSRIDINSGATLVAGGSQQFGLLTTSGAGVGTWQGNLTNFTAVAPGGEGGIGTLAVSGDFTNSPSGTLKLDIASAAHDSLTITGSAAFGGAFDLNQSGPDGIAPFVPVKVVAADSYSGNFTTFTENLEGAVWFNPSNGDIIRIDAPGGAGGFPFGATRNQTSTWISLYDDVIDPGVTNITRNPGGNPTYDISSGIADAGNPDLMWALTASFTPDGLNAALLNRLSPEVYAGFSDYAVQANREHMRSALNAPALPPVAPPSHSGSKGGAKDATVSTPGQIPWEVFAAVDYFNVETDNSQNQADYELSGAGFIAGVRAHPATGFQLAAWLAADDGKVSGHLIDADASGITFGLAAEFLLDKTTATRITAGLGHGIYQFDGTRGSASATADGWSPGRVGFSDVENNATELFLEIETVAYRDENFRLIPSAAIRHSSGSTDSFTESTGAAAGSPIALDVRSDDYSMTLAELSLNIEADLTSQLTLRGLLGLSTELSGDTHNLTANFVKGGRPMHATADGLSGDLVFLGLGAEYRISDFIRMHFGYRAEFRSGAETQVGLNLSSSIRF